MNARGITVDWLNFYQPLRERITCRTTMSGICDKVLFALMRSPPLCLRGSRCTQRAPLSISDNDFEFDKELARF